jgi:hypothetical protein
MRKTILAFLLMFTLSALFADESENCKLTIQTIKNNRAKIKVLLVHANDDADCRAKGKEKQITSDAEEKITVSAGFIPKPAY